MCFNPTCLINVLMAFVALVLYFVGSYRFYHKRSGFKMIIGTALLIDVVTATLASLKITPTTQIPGTEAVPWDSILFKLHVILSMIGIIGFLALFIYLLICKSSAYKTWIRKGQFIILLPVWVVGELIALSNALCKICLSVRLFDCL